MQDDTMVDVPGRSPPTVRSRLAGRGADVVLVTVRELRLLLGLLLVLFVTSETWRYIGQLSTFRLVLFVLAALTASLVVVGLGLRRTLGRSAAGRATVRVAVEVVLFSASLFVTFAAVGVVSVDAALVAEWSGGQGGVLVSLGLGDPPLVMTRQLLQVAAFLAALGGLSFAVEVVADAGTRSTLVGDLVEPAAVDEVGAAAEGERRPAPGTAGDGRVEDSRGGRS